MKEISRKWLILPIEVQPREYHSRLLMALDAVNHGCGVILGRQANIQSNLHNYPVGVYFDKSADGDKLLWYQDKLLSRSGMHLVSNDEEGLAAENRKSFYIEHRYSEVVHQHLRKFFTWGTQEADLIISHFPSMRGKVFAYGNARVDIWKSKLKGIYAQPAAVLRRRYGPYILMPSSFARARYALGQAFLDREAVRRGFLADEEARTAYTDMEQWQKKTLSKFEGLAVELASRFRDHTIVVRPHPSEDIAQVREFARGMKNISVVYEGSIAPWIMGSTAVVHSHCTTGLEAFLMRHPVVAYRPVEENSYADFISNQVGAIARTPEEVIGFVDEIIDGRYREASHWNNGQEVLKNRIASLGDEMAHSQIVGELLGIADWYSDTLKISSRGLVNDWQTECRSRLCKKMGRSEPFIWRQSPYYRQKFPGLSARMVRKDLSVFSKLLDVTMPRNVRSINDSVFAIFD